MLPRTYGINILRADLLGRALAGALMASAAFAQTSQGTISRRELTLGGTGLQIALNSVPTGVDWVVAVKVQAAGTGYLGAYIASATLDPTLTGPRGPLQDLTDLPPSSYSISNGSIAVNGSAITKTGVMVYAAIPQSTRVQVSANGATVWNGVVASSLMIRSGTLIPEEVTEPGQAIQRLKKPYAPVPDIGVRANGAIFASPAEAQRHLVQGSVPAQTAPSAKVHSASLELTISAAGRVVSMKVLGGGDAALAASMEGPLAQCVFAPFVFNGKAVQLETVVGFMALPDGRIQSTLK